MVRQVRTSTGIIGLLCLPGYQTVLDVNLPAARAGAVNTMGRAYDLVMLPTLPVAVLPVAGFIGYLTMSIRKLAGFLFKKLQSIKKMTHVFLLLFTSFAL